MGARGLQEIVGRVPRPGAMTYNVVYSKKARRFHAGLTKAIREKVYRRDMKMRSTYQSIKATDANNSSAAAT